MNQDKAGVIFTREVKLKMIIGISGKSGSGKNETARILTDEMGFYEIDADKLGHSVLEKLSSEIEAVFNIRLKRKEGQLDRSELAKVVFSDPAKLQQLEDIIYPILSQEIRQLTKEHPKCTINAVKLFDSGLYKICDTVIWMYAPLKIRLRRAAKRDSRQISEIKARFRAQNKLSAQPWKKSVDIYKVSNAKTLNHLKAQLHQVYRQIEARR